MSAQAARESLRRARRLVVKVGSGVLTRDGRLRPRLFASIAGQVSALRDEGREVVVVSSGAIAIGARELGWSHAGRSIPEKQAAAAIGQIGLVERYQRHFRKHGKHVAQVLVTRSGLEDRERFLNARHTLTTLLDLGVIPIVNENDTVATEEIRFGDNDNLSATLVNLVAADLLVILTDVPGLLREPPRRGRRAPPRFDVIEAITPEIERAAQGSSRAFGRGGMTTKLAAAQAAARCGAATVLCSGFDPGALRAIVEGADVGTLFVAGSRLASRKHWLAFTKRTRGELVLDEGAARALLERGKSLLPAGIVAVRGRFRIGDPVTCVDREGRELARGLVAYGSDAIARIAGTPTSRVAQVLGYSNGDEVIHRDDLVRLHDVARDSESEARSQTGSGERRSEGSAGEISEDGCRGRAARRQP